MNENREFLLIWGRVRGLMPVVKENPLTLTNELTLYAAYYYKEHYEAAVQTDDEAKLLNFKAKLIVHAYDYLKIFERARHV